MRNFYGKRVHKILLTGGPCGGKTSAQHLLAEHFRTLKWTVYCVPEAATILRPGGVDKNQMSEEQICIWQRNMVKTIIQLETVYDQLADKEAQNDVLILCDRGVLDPRAYTDANLWKEIEKVNGIEQNNAFSRYEMVIHLVSCAKGAENAYTTTNNAARLEKDIESAREKDEQCMHIWQKHTNFHVVRNEESFEEKVAKSTEILREFLTTRKE